VELVSLAGKLLRTIPGATVGLPGAGEIPPFTRAFVQLIDTDPSLVIIQSASGVGYRVYDGGIERLDPARIPIAGGAYLSESSVKPYVYRVTLHAHGLTMSSTSLISPSFSIVDSGRLLVTPGYALDLVSHRRWTRPAGFRWGAVYDPVPKTCLPAGEDGGRLIATCVRGSAANSSMSLYAVGSDGGLTRLGRPYAVALGSMIAWLSPNHEFVLTQLGSTCGVGPALVARISDGRFEPAGPGETTALGWTSDNQMITTRPVQIAGDCGGVGLEADVVQPQGRIVRAISRAGLSYTVWGV
jgi:hypothetical protein